MSSALDVTLSSDLCVLTHKSSLLLCNWTLLEVLNSSSLRLQFVVFRCKSVKQKTDMFFFKWLCTSTESHKPPHNNILWVSACFFTAATCIMWDRIVSWHQIFLCQCHFLGYFAHRNLIDISCWILWGLGGGSIFFACFSLLQNVCQKNNMCKYHQGSRAGSYMLFRVSQQYSAGRKTQLIAVLTEMHKWDRSYQAWPHCTKSWQWNLAEKPSGPKTPLKSFWKQKQTFWLPGGQLRVWEC